MSTFLSINKYSLYSNKNKAKRLLDAKFKGLCVLNSILCLCDIHYILIYINFLSMSPKFHIHAIKVSNPYSVFVTSMSNPCQIISICWSFKEELGTLTPMRLIEVLKIIINLETFEDLETLEDLETFEVFSCKSDSTITNVNVISRLLSFSACFLPLKILDTLWHLKH